MVNTAVDVLILIAASYFCFWSVVVNEEVRESRRANRKMERSE